MIEALVGLVGLVISVLLGVLISQVKDLKEDLGKRIDGMSHDIKANADELNRVDNKIIKLEAEHRIYHGSKIARVINA